MGKKIQVLPNRTINQIAAGEVIENPSSVVKELVENAIDAGAKQIQVELSGGGFQLIRIVDNGHGMAQDDAILSFERHATSKIGDVEDLERLSTMGFRGEALASIASVAKVTMLTSDGISGTKIELAGGDILRVDPCARQRGTTIEVRSLFYNIPVRKKFQKSATVSTGEISRIITKLSLGYPHIGFTLASHDRELLRTEAGNLEERIRDVLGNTFVAGCTSLFGEWNGMRIEGFIGLPKAARSNRSGQYLYINKRNVVSPVVQDAVQEAYATMVQSKEFPIFVMHILVEGSAVDVNVHPQKKEVRLKDEGVLRQRLIETIGTALDQTIVVPKVEIGELEQALNFTTFSFKEESHYEVPKFAEVVLPWEEIVPFGIGVFSKYFFIDASSIALLGGDGLALVDLEASSSRIHYDAIMQEGERIEKQNLLFPETVELSRADALIVHENIDELDRIGLTMRKFGETTFIVEAIADAYEGQDFLSLITSFIEELRENRTEKIHALALKACRFIKKSHGTYQMPEAIAILSELLKCKTPLFCPMGNCTIVKVEKHELQNWFSVQQKNQNVKKMDS